MEFWQCWSLIYKAYCIMNDFTFPEKYKRRTFQFSLDILKLYSTIPKIDETRILGKQLIRCATSIGANFRAACVARSYNERFSKFCIVVEEADEALYWLQLLKYCHLNINIPDNLIIEAQELTKVMSSCKRKVGQKIGKYK